MLKPGSADYLSGMKDVLEKQGSLQARQEYFKRQMDMREQMVIEQLFKDVVKATGEVAKEKGFDMVLEKSEPDLPAANSNELTLTISTHKVLYSSPPVKILPTRLWRRLTQIRCKLATKTQRREVFMELTVTELAKRLKAELIGDGDGVIRSVGPVGAADQTTLTFLADEKHLAELKKSRCGAAIVNKAIEGFSQPQLVVKNVNAALIEALKIFAPKLRPAVPGVDSTAKVAAGVKMGKNVSIGACVVIEDGVEIGDDTIIAAGCKIGQNTKIGQATRLDCNVVVYHNCTIGNNVIIQANTTNWFCRVWLFFH